MENETAVILISTGILILLFIGGLIHMWVRWKKDIRLDKEMKQLRKEYHENDFNKWLKNGSEAK